MDYRQMYDSNTDFKAYVDKYVKQNHVPLDVALSHKMVQNYGEYLTARGDSEIHLQNLWGTAGQPHGINEEVG